MELGDETCLFHKFKVVGKQATVCLDGCCDGAHVRLEWHTVCYTPLWNSSLILLHAEPGNGTIRVTGAKLENLVVVDTCSDEFIEDGRNSLSQSRLLPFLSCQLPIVVLDKDTELSLLKRAFGRNVDISLEDFRPQMEKVMPKTKGKSLFDLSVFSRAANSLNTCHPKASLRKSPSSFLL